MESTPLVYIRTMRRVHLIWLFRQSMAQCGWPLLATVLGFSLLARFVSLVDIYHNIGSVDTVWHYPQYLSSAAANTELTVLVFTVAVMIAFLWLTKNTVRLTRQDLLGSFSRYRS